MPEITKAYAMSDVKISYVSLVDKAANKRRFLITKAENGSATFQTYGRIVKADADTHEVTGIVYEPMVEDTDGNFMTEEEIIKAAHWFMKNKGGVDLQHSFEPLEGASVVESHVAKCEEEIGGEKIQKGTWVMTMDIENDEIFEKIQKGELTGFSMGGIGMFSEEDVQLPERNVSKQERKGILKTLAKLLGISEEPVSVEKGAVREQFDRQYAAENLRDAWYILQDTLTYVWNPETGRAGPEPDMSKVEEALQDFNDITRMVFSHSAEPESIFKCAEGEEMPPIVKAGRKMSAKNIETLRSIHANLGAFLSSFEETEDTTEEVEEVTKEEMEQITKSVTESVTAGITEAIQKAMAPAQPAAPAADPNPAPAMETITKAEIQEMIDVAIRKATGEEDPDAEGEPAELTQEELIEKAVAKALKPFLESAGLPTNIKDSVQKEEEHYMHGLL